jgi:predicted phage terminase large subunit-like protein
MTASPLTAAEREELAIRHELALRRAVTDLGAFTRLCWPVVEGRPLVWGWYHSAICRMLEAQMAGDPRRLAVAIPPRCMKSYLVSVMLPAWVWLRRPEWSVLAIANEESLATRDSARARQILRSDVYGEIQARAVDQGAPAWSLDRAQQEKVNYATTRGGIRQCLSVGARVTGKGADWLIMDDLVDARAVVHGDPARVAERMAEVNAYRREVLETRFNDRGEARATIIGQRLHEADPPGECIREGYASIVLPMRFDPHHPERSPADRRTTAGELLDPKRFPEVEVAALEKSLGDQAPGQLQQRPQAKEGGMFRASWFLWLDRSEWPEPRDYRATAQGWDLAMGAGDSAAYTAGFVGGYLGGKVHVGAGYRGRWEITEQTAAIQRARREHPYASRTWIENRANARAVFDLLRRTVPGLIGVEPDGDKVTRAQRWAGYVEGGAVVFPCRCGAKGYHTHDRADQLPGEPWAVDAVREVCAFPRGAFADQVDALGYLVRGLVERASVGGVTLSEAV